MKNQISFGALLVALVLSVGGLRAAADDLPLATPFKTQDFYIRDPFVLVENGRYYMYESYGWKEGLGVAVRQSVDLENWTAPECVMLMPKDVPSVAVWASEVHKYEGKYYLFTTITEPQGTRSMKVFTPKNPADSQRPRGTWIFVADKPTGPFVPVKKGPIPPDDFMTLDGTLYLEEGQPYMVYCHEWKQLEQGTIDYAPLSKDLKSFTGEPKTILKAREAIEGAWVVTDGPFFYRSTKSKRLYLIWSNFTKDHKYCVFVRSSASGTIAGPWTKDEILFGKNGGHAMLFNDLSGKLRLALHQPNEGRNERAHFFDVSDDGEHLRLVEK